MNHDHHAHMMGAKAETTTAHNHAAMADTTHNHGAMTTDSMGNTEAMDHGGMMMQMYFEAGYKAIILFKEWDTQSVGAMVGSCIGIFLLAVLYEGLKFSREALHRRNYMAINYSNVQGAADGSQSSQSKTALSSAQIMMRAFTTMPHYVQTLLHLVQLTLSYFLMLIVMTYNVWLFVSVVLGCTAGYFLFGWQKGFTVDLTEHCH